MSNYYFICQRDPPVNPTKSCCCVLKRNISVLHLRPENSFPTNRFGKRIGELDLFVHDMSYTRNYSVFFYSTHDSFIKKQY